jgi:hypothetical protein
MCSYACVLCVWQESHSNVIFQDGCQVGLRFAFVCISIRKLSQMGTRQHGTTRPSVS